MTPDQAFDRYEKIRDRLPAAPQGGDGIQIAGLHELADQIDVFVFDAFGVLNVGERPIPGAHDRVQQLREMGKQVLVLTNAASFTRAQTEAKFSRLGFEFAPSEIISSRQVCEAHLASINPNGQWGVIAPPDFFPDDLEVDALALQGDQNDYDQVQAFLMLSAAGWNADRQTLLRDSLRRTPRPLVVANPDLVAPREDGLSLEPGFYAHELQDQLGGQVIFHGKPFASVYETVERRFPDINLNRIAMIGDTLHTDILGARARGWRAALITDHGLFAGLDVHKFIDASGIAPDWIAPSI
ncbi:TIGR01459 family HAD-type hydrolase [Parasedimentitalea marina]|uniref:TIGR01459 family HAD-type hydrolase n=1 Tax=Parasedimentitalea marina TaxID=2483033 RepID=A0A3T0MXN6_9RHOB|nr:TIGR01459 family HAD-type hydrolase [Parasedimentitalea marina]AZV76519.1 TIGR01459 family HAD-type hydrolase [Parasedimentitalea marina]